MRRSSPRFIVEQPDIEERKNRLITQSIKTATIMLKYGDFDQAVLFYDICLRVDPENVLAKTGKTDLLVTIAKKHFENNQYEKCLQTFRDALAIKADNANANREIATSLHTLAKYHVDSGNYHEAIKCFSECLSAKTDDKQVKIDALLGCTRAIIRTHSLDHCVPLLSRARELIGHENCPQYKAAFYEYKGLKLRRNKHFDDALANYKKLLALEPDNLIALAGIGLLSRSSEPDFSLACIVKALVLQPDSIQYLQIKAMNHKDNNEFEKELACYNRILELDPDNTSIKMHKVGVLHRISNSTDATRESRKELQYPGQIKKRR